MFVITLHDHYDHSNRFVGVADTLETAKRYAKREADAGHVTYGVDIKVIEYDLSVDVMSEDGYFLATYYIEETELITAESLDVVSFG